MAESFSREAAEALLPQIAPLVWDLQRQHRRADSAAATVADLQARSKGNGHGLAQQLARAEQEGQSALMAMNQLIERINSMGIEVKDAEMGLVDFRSEMGGRPMYLCWKLGEEHIEWWHELDAGYAGRQRLD